MVPSSCCYFFTGGEAEGSIFVNRQKYKEDVSRGVNLHANRTLCSECHRDFGEKEGVKEGIHMGDNCKKCHK